MHDELNLLDEPPMAASDPGLESRSLRFPGKIPPSILVVDDNLTYRLVLCALLQQMGAVTTQAVNGDDAITCASREQFDVVLMDIGLPDMDGFEAAERIQNVSREHVPVIACTAYEGLVEHEAPVSAGLSAVITKPAGRRSVFMAILECMSAEKIKKENILAPKAEASTSYDENSILDLDSLSAMIGDLAPETRALILASVPIDTKASLTALNSAALDSDLDKIEVAAHQLKGLARTFGARKLAALADELHMLSRAGLNEEALACVPAVQAGVRQMLEALAAVRMAA